MSDLGNNSQYQSGGRFYTSPNKIIEQESRNEFYNKVGGRDGIASKDQAEIANIIQNMLERIASESQVTNNEISQMVSAIKESVMNAPNVQQGAKEGMNTFNELVSNNLSLLQSFEKQNNLSLDNNALKQVNESPLKQLIHTNQGILNILQQMERNTSVVGNNINSLRLDSLNNEKSKKSAEEAQHAEQMSGFDRLRNALLFMAVSSPLVSRLNQLGSSLISLGLMKVMGNEKAPDILRKGAATAIYLKVPETIMLGISTLFSGWLFNVGSKHLGTTFTNIGNAFKNSAKGILTLGRGLFSNIGKLLTGIIPRIIPLLLNPWTLAITAIVGVIAAGVGLHKMLTNRMDENIDRNPELTNRQKDKEKIKAHGASGALTGMASGAISGAIIGSIVPGIGTAVGAAIGGAIGLIGGGLIGVIKPLKTAIDNGSVNISKFLKSISNTILNIFTFLSPFGLVFRGIYEWVKGLISGKSSVVGAHVGNAVQNVKEFFTGPSKDKLVNMSDLGLKGTVWTGNSKPYTLKDNANKVKQLDYLLDSWGFDVMYTSNMGGKHQIGPRSHASGNKVDFQLYRDGKPAYLNEWQTSELTRLGYFGHGAKGWENHSEQVGGGHYDAHTGSHVSFDTKDPYLAGLKKEYEEQKIREQKEIKKEAEVEEKNNDVDKELPMQSYQSNPVYKDNSGPQRDLSGMQDYVTKQNSTNVMVNVGTN